MHVSLHARVPRKSCRALTRTEFVHDHVSVIVWEKCYEVGVDRVAVYAEVGLPEEQVLSRRVGEIDVKRLEDAVRGEEPLVRTVCRSWSAK